MWMFIPIEKWILTLKMIQREVPLFKPKHQFIYPNEKNELVVPNHYKKRDYYVNPYLSQLKDELSFFKMVQREVVLMKPRHQYHLS